MVLEEAAQLEWKQRVLADALGRIGGIRPDADEIRAGADRLGYRNRVELTLGRDDAGRPVLGFHAAGDSGPRALVDVESCPVQLGC